jgi:hypothetical protein
MRLKRPSPSLVISLIAHRRGQGHHPCQVPRLPRRGTRHVEHVRAVVQRHRQPDAGPGRDRLRADIGSVRASCFDENAAAGTLDPATTLTFANTSGDAVNLRRRVGNGDAVVAAMPNGTTHAFTIRGSNTFELHLERRATNYVVNGVVRQDGRRTASAACLVYGYSVAIPSG